MTKTSAPVIVTTDVKNDPEIGLDPHAKSMLKPEPEAEVVVADVVKTPVDAAEAYAAGATKDPLGKEAPKKTKVTKKV